MQTRTKITALGLCGNSVFLNVDHFHVPGETVHAQGLYAEPGGKGYNQAVAAARLGGSVCFIGCIGDDADGRACMEFLRREGITPVPQIHPTVPSAYACILTDKDGENRVTVFQGAAQELTAEFILEQEAVIAESDLLLLNNEYPQECNEAAMALAIKHGVKVVYNPAPARPVSPEFLADCFLVTPNLSESAILIGEAVTELPALVQRFRSSGIQNAVVTLGGDGAALITPTQALRIPVRKTRAVDTTGAGDTFTAALSVAVLQGKSLVEAAQWAANAAALSVSRQYVMPGLPTRTQLEADFVELTPEEIE